MRAINKYDIIIPCGSKDISFVPQVVKYIKKFICEADNIYIITNERYFSKIKKIEGVRFVDENQMLNYLNFDVVKKLLAKKKWYVRQGWYFQQFLKLGFALTPYAKKYYLSWDADTLPLHELSFFDKDGYPVFSKKTEYHAAYFETNEKLIGIGKTQPYSFIAEHMLFNVDYVKELISTIEASCVIGENWVEKCVGACEFSQTDIYKEPYFSEFELYGSFVMEKHPVMYKTRILRSFRHGGMIRGRYIGDALLKELSFDLDIASFEADAKAPFPYNVNSWLNAKIHRFDKFINMPFRNLPMAVLKAIGNRMFI